jgi:uncharacterized membrane protein
VGNLRVSLYTPRGWYQEAASKPLPSIKPGKGLSIPCVFRVPSTERPQIAPVTVKLECDGKPVSTPCTLMVNIAE